MNTDTKKTISKSTLVFSVIPAGVYPVLQYGAGMTVYEALLMNSLVTLKYKKHYLKTFASGSAKILQDKVYKKILAIISVNL